MISTALAVEYAQAVDGWMRVDELWWLAELARRQRPGCTWVEVGTWKGRSWAAVALSLPVRAQLIAVDTFDGGTADDDATIAGHLQATGSVRDDFDRVRNAIADQRTDLTVPVICALSAAAVRYVGDRTADVVFIDGDHHAAHVCEDVTIWLAKLKPGGVLCGHDADDARVVEGLTMAGMVFDVVCGSIWMRR